MNRERAIKRLNHLIAICRDSEEGFREAAELVKIPDLKELFTMISEERAAFGRELQARVTAAGGSPVKTKDLPGTVRLLSLELRSALSRNHPYAILSECERGEDAAQNAYLDVLDEEAFTPEMREVTRRQFEFVRLSRDRIIHLRQIADPSYKPLDAPGAQDAP